MASRPSPTSQRKLNRSDSDLGQRPSQATYELRPQVQSGTHTGQVVAKSPKKKTDNITVQPSRPSLNEDLLARVTKLVKEAAKHLRDGEPREAIPLLKRAYRIADTAPTSGDGLQAGMLGRATVRLQLAEVYSALGQHRQALEEATSSSLEADASWQAMLSFSLDPSTPPLSLSGEAPLPETALRALLQNPPPWLERTSEVSVFSRCRAATSLLAATAAGATAADEGTAAMKEASRLCQEAEMLSRHFLPDEHPASKTARRALGQICQLWVDGKGSLSGPVEARESVEAAPGPDLDTSAQDSISPLADLSEDEMQSWKAAQETQLPPLSGLQSRSRLPPSRDGAATMPVSLSLQELPTTSSQPPSPDSPPAPAILRAPPPPIGWTGRCAPGDVYVSTLPAQPQRSLSATGRKSKKTLAEPTAAQVKRCEGAAGGRSRSVTEYMAPPPPPNAFKDWATSFDDPTRNDIKRIVMRSDEASKRITNEMRDKSLTFKSRWLGSLSDTELYEDRITFCGYGMRATRIGEKRMKEWQKTYGWGDSEETTSRRATRHDLFKHYKVDPGKGEPGMKALAKLLKESDLGRDKHPKKSTTKQEQLQNDFKAMFGGKKLVEHGEEEKPQIDEGLGKGLMASFRKSSKVE